LGKIRFLLAIALTGAIAFPLQASPARLHKPSAKLQKPSPQKVIQRPIPLSDYAQTGLEMAIANRLVQPDSRFTEKLRMVVLYLRSGNVESVAQQTGVKAQVIERLVQMGMSHSRITTAATPESATILEEKDEEF
jgi:hypothetical protein